MAADDPLRLTDKGARIISRGGADGLSDDDLLVLEIAERAPGMSREDLLKCFVSCRLEYGEDALRAIQSGHVKFEVRKPQ